jgi:DNA-binding transcriptional ArsR family regulator
MEKNIGSRDQDSAGGNENDSEKMLTAAERVQLAMAERRRQVASLLAQSRTETEIALALGVHQSTVSRDVQALREESGRFVQELAKSELVFSYQQSLKGIDEVKRRLWDWVNSDSATLSTRDRLMAFRLILVAEETRFRLLEKGPMVSSYDALSHKVDRLEQGVAVPGAA